MKAQMERLDLARSKAREVESRRERLKGLLEERVKRVKEFEDKARSDFDCDVSELPKMVENLRKEAEAAVRKAEEILGLAKDVDEDDGEDPDDPL